MVPKLEQLEDRLPPTPIIVVIGIENNYSYQQDALAWYLLDPSHPGTASIGDVLYGPDGGDISELLLGDSDSGDIPDKPDQIQSQSADNPYDPDNNEPPQRKQPAAPFF